MDAFHGLMYGLEVVLTPENLFAALVGVFIGTAIGVLPGLGPVAGAALVLPFTLTLDPVMGVIVISGIYYGAMYGGSTTSVLLNLPGDASSVITTIDGYERTRAGRAGPTLAIMAVGSFIAGTIAVCLILVLAPMVADLGVKFGPAEFFALILGGLIALGNISGGRLMSSMFPLFIGLALGTVGLEPLTSTNRFTFGVLELSTGVSLTALVLGIFGISEVIMLIEGTRESPKVERVRVRDLMPSREEWRRSGSPWARGTLIGFFFGLLPGPSATMSSFTSYRVEQTFSKHRDELGKGAIEGVAGPEAANNAAATSSMLPVLALGIPFSATLAIMLAGLMVQGITPGPLLITQHPEIFWGVIASMYVGNVMLMILNLPMIGVWVRMLQVPQHMLIVIILVLAVIGAFSENSSMTSVVIMALLGLVGYVLRKLNFNLVPLVLGLVLGPLVEGYLIRGLYDGGGDLLYFIKSPIAAAVWALVLAYFVLPPLVRRVPRRSKKGAATVSYDEN